ncbi:hypothetical protein [Humidisolicoccus flavus]|uniref:hypothetical protein n=1 Tax=Humidisolicoccus flavus TaxID=3111414 RepID=UPI00324A75D7
MQQRSLLAPALCFSVVALLGVLALYSLSTMSMATFAIAMVMLVIVLTLGLFLLWDVRKTNDRVRATAADSDGNCRVCGRAFNAS